MKSNKQRRAEIKARRTNRVEMRKAIDAIPANALAVDPHLIIRYNTYGWSFCEDGYYRPHSFNCRDCGKAEVWTPAQQKWWFEKMRAAKYQVAVRCRACRKQHAAARSASIAGLLKKKIEQKT